MSPVHVVPVGDVIAHDTSSVDACVCGPDVEYGDEGFKLVTHHSLDGREHDEPDHDRAGCPLCSGQEAA